MFEILSYSRCGKLVSGAGAMSQVTAHWSAHTVNHRMARKSQLELLFFFICTCLLYHFIFRDRASPLSRPAVLNGARFCSYDQAKMSRRAPSVISSYGQY